MNRLLVMAVFLVASFVALGSVAPNADAEEPRPWTAQVDPLTTALGFVHLQIERRLAKTVSVYAGPHARLFSGLGSDEGEDHRGVGVELGVRWFFRPKVSAPAGFWAQTRGVLARVSLDDESELGGYVSALVGYTYIASRRWVLAGGLGVQYLHYSVGGVGTEGVLPAAHTTVGLSF